MQTFARLRERAASSRAGTALLFAAFTTVSMVALGAAFLCLGSRSSKEVAARADEVRAACVAEVGVSEALTAMRAGASGGVGTIGAPALVGNGVFWASAQDLGNGRTRLDVTALEGSGRCALEVVVDDGSRPIFSSMLFADTQLDIAQNVLVDSYDSLQGTYASQATNSQNGKTFARAGGNARSNAQIDLDVDAGIFGSAMPGPFGTVALAGGSFVTGSTNPAPDPLNLAPIPVPVLPSSGPLTIPQHGTLDLPPGNYRFDDLFIDRNGRLHVQGPAEIVFANYTMASRAQLYVDGSAGPVTVHVEGQFQYHRYARIFPDSGSPADIAFNVTNDDYVQLESLSNFLGGMYAPNTHFDIQSDCQLFGSLMARRIDVGASSQFHFDEHLLRRMSPPSEDIAIVSWTRTTPALALLTDRSDAFRLLNLSRSSLPRPVNAWIP